MNADIKRIISKVMDGSRIGKNELVDLLKCDDVSEEAFAIRAAGGYLMRQRTQNAGVIFGQIGIEMHPVRGQLQLLLVRLRLHPVDGHPP